MAIAAHSNFILASVNIRAVFLQSKVLDIEVYVKPPENVRKPGLIWRLKKHLYNLDDASSKFWLRVKEVLTEMGLWVLDVDEAFYFLQEDGHLQGVVITHIYDFHLAGTDDFFQKVLD